MSHLYSVAEDSLSPPILLRHCDERRTYFLSSLLEQPETVDVSRLADGT